MITCQNLHKNYGKTAAVKGIDLEVAEGETFGFLGPNGAGKSTTIWMLSTLVRPTSGWAEVAGFDVVYEAPEVRRRIGLVFQEKTIDSDLTAAENLHFHASLYGISRASGRDRAKRLLTLMDLADRANDRVATLSGGMRRRLEVARCLMHDPRLLILDEPTAGLDPHARALVWDTLHRLRQDAGITLFLTTHYLDEAEHCDHIAIIDKGALVTEGSPEELKGAIGADVIHLRTEDDSLAADRLVDRLQLKPVRLPDGLRVPAVLGADLVPRLCAELGVLVHSVSVTRPSLDDVFLHHTGHAFGDHYANGAYFVE